MMFDADTLTAFGLYLVRVSSLVLFAPVLGTGAVFSGYRTGLIIALSLMLYATGDSSTVADVGAVEFALFALREFMIGTFLAFVLHAVVIAVRVGGDLIGHEMGFAMAAIVDPASGIRTPLVAHMYEVFFYLGFLASDGHHWLIRALNDSFKRAPIGQLPREQGMTSLVVQSFGELFAAGLTLGAPVLVLLSLVSVLIGILARIVPQLNVLEFGFSLRIAVAIFAMFMFTPLLGTTLDILMGELTSWLDKALEVVAS